MKLTSRIKQIIAILLDQQEYITANDIADRIQVSARTVLRELDEVEKWLQVQDIVLEKKKGFGIRARLDRADIRKVNEWLHNEETEISFFPEQRYTILKAALLMEGEPTKLYTLTRLLDVTESTIANDLEHITPWFGKFDIELIRKPGLGVYIQADEEAIRRAMIALLYDHFHEANLITFIINLKIGSTAGITLPNGKEDALLLNLMDIAYIPVIKNLISYLEAGLGYQLADNAYIALVIRFIVTVKRIRQGYGLALESTLKKQLKQEKVYQLIRKWVLEHGDNAIRELSEDECLYLTMHIKGAKLRESFVDNGISMIEDYKMIRLAKKIIRVAEIKTGTYLEDNEKLLRGLVRHLGPAINRIKLKLDIMNPLLKDIQEIYPELFQAAKECVKVIEQEEGVAVPEDETAYIAIHIGAGIKNQKHSTTTKYRVVVACANGIGASQMLATEIEKTFHQVHVVEVISTLELNESAISRHHADLIISTVPTPEVGIPSVYVNPILSHQDKMKIEKLLGSIEQKRWPENRSGTLHLKDKLLRLNQYNLTVIEVLDNFQLLDEADIRNMNELIPFVSRSIGRTEEARRELEKAFLEREEKGSTILGKKGMMLLHCRTPAVDQLYFMVVRGKEKIKVTGSKAAPELLGAIGVMVAPLDAKSVALEILSEISRSIITSEFSHVLKHGSAQDIYMALSGILDLFIQSKVIADE